MIAVVGAGASFASGSYAPSERPPLTTEIFSCAEAEDVMRDHRLAQKAGRIIGRRIAANGALALEHALRELRTDGNPQHSQMAFDVPLYLQELLLRYSEKLEGRAERYDALVDELLKLPTHVCFVSLNYDLLLDNCLAPHHPLRTLDDYVVTRDGRRARNWSLIKPHGSVNWFVEVDEFDVRSPDPDIAVPPGPVHVRPSDEYDLERLRGFHPRGGVSIASRYPVLALPEGAKDHLSLPREHLSSFQSLLRESAQVDVLVLGYSAIDTEVLSLINASGAKVRRLTVVNRDARANLDVLTAIKAFGIEAIWPDTPNASYAEWVDGDGLTRWVREFGGIENGPYPSRVDPDELREQLAFADVMGLEEPPDEHDLLTRPM